MATWWNLAFEGEPTEADFAHVAEAVAQGFLGGQLINEDDAEDEEGPATGYWPGGQPVGHHWAAALRMLGDEGSER